ncbi:MAG TPA: single-stranded DNA-binding protein [Terrimesophilobacter sp.]|nr:single-stranded DNA-binding protein [Terrimesophilobacter sp.]
MNDIITLRGTVGTDPRQIKTATGLDITSFRLASTQRRYDRQKQEWVDGDTNWYGISTYRQLARNTGMSIKKGEPVIVTGRIKVQRWESGEKKGLTIDVDADSVGHDLLWGTASYTRSLRKADLGPGADNGEHGDADTTAEDARETDHDDELVESGRTEAVPTPF